uniref:SGF29 C-terminal domain-containing protein n=1 Tax=Craspedostauros australis TaxID=1486917 RepID=A0A7R9WSY6_9STRA|mmetsp:Transcript_17072/g.47285  ORF Transcript_17072/g.47285 Transcript_17072/m.47285 type:complete len:292 (+) Transcript_17072:136-1011(+)|eukprot:CAMPEP_0198116242 /NCGR_PEP_ID=MMETSP1442-20131203/10631_1 /TAXON_ID= /ORGANISM="Craspedostauros australis, Strain CCMP3328" /LENGTH=291 /DNA_ID=CAMNT_0043774013 /DNA_START=58 /DNA_END=933 /DNA_ORIENTATION=+
MTRSDVTYLESFVEEISTIPHEIKRNMDLIQSLDRSSNETIQEMMKLQQQYVDDAEKKVLGLDVVDNRGIRVAKRKRGSAKSKATADDNLVVPTTEELAEYIHNEDMYSRIRECHQSAEQYAAEKCAIADQSCALIEDVCDRLDEDLKHLEQVLQRSGDFQVPGAAKPNDLAAIQPTAGGSEWILAKVISYDPHTGMYKLSDEDVESNKTFSLPQPQVAILGDLKNLARGDAVFAIYPDTTAFYQATVVQPPGRKSSTGNTFVMVNFLDDEDANGIIHDKAILLQHIMLPP